MMNSAADTRRERLREIIKREGLASAAKRFNKPDRQLNDMLAGRKSFGEKVARAMERSYDSSLPPGWLDAAPEQQIEKIEPATVDLAAVADQSQIDEAARTLAEESAEIARMWLTIQQDRREYIRRLLEDEVTAATEVKKSTSGDGGMQQNIADPLDGFKTPAVPRQTKREQKKESR